MQLTNIVNKQQKQQTQAEKHDGRMLQLYKSLTTKQMQKHHIIMGRHPGAQWIHDSASGQTVYKIIVTASAMRKALVSATTPGGTYTIDPTAQIQDWATRFQVMFKEYRVLGIDIEEHPLGYVSLGGYFKMWIDEKSATVPVQADAVTVSGWNIPIALTSKVKIRKWRAKDLGDLAYTATQTSFVPGYVKVFYDTTFFSPAGAISIFFPVNYLMEFRQLHD